MAYFIAIDGLDGSGKATQSKLLCKALESAGKKVRTISFPTYEEKASMLVNMYLSGELGGKASDTGAYAASTFFSMDRYISYRTDWHRDYKDKDTVILADRYTSANAVHQLSKLDRAEWDGFLSWLVDYEYSKLGLPCPDTVVYLEVKPEISMKLIKSRSEQTGRNMDIHELDPDFLNKSYEAAIYASDKLNWIKIKCYDGDEMRTIEDIASEVLERVTARLQTRENRF